MNKNKSVWCNICGKETPVLYEWLYLSIYKPISVFMCHECFSNIDYRKVVEFATISNRLRHMGFTVRSFFDGIKATLNSRFIDTDFYRRLAKFREDLQLKSLDIKKDGKKVEVIITHHDVSSSRREKSSAFCSLCHDDTDVVIHFYYDNVFVLCPNCAKNLYVAHGLFPDFVHNEDVKRTLEMLSKIKEQLNIKIVLIFGTIRLEMKDSSYLDKVFRILGEYKIYDYEVTFDEKGVTINLEKHYKKFRNK